MVTKTILKTGESLQCSLLYSKLLRQHSTQRFRDSHKKQIPNSSSMPPILGVALYGYLSRHLQGFDNVGHYHFVYALKAFQCDKYNMKFPKFTFVSGKNRTKVNPKQFNWTVPQWYPPISFNIAIDAEFGDLRDEKIVNAYGHFLVADFDSLTFRAFTNDQVLVAKDFDMISHLEDIWEHFLNETGLKLNPEKLVGINVAHCCNGRYFFGFIREAFQIKNKTIKYLGVSFHEKIN